MGRIDLALLQMASSGTDVEANLRKADAFCRRAAEQGADLALFPEMWNVGYTLRSPGDPEYDDWLARAVDCDDPFVAHFRRLARELDMAIAVTYLERWPGAPRNTLSLIDRRGEVALTYAKVHTCDFSLEAALTPGDGFRVCQLDTRAGPVQVGAMICYDREFPESARVLMLEGAELILTPNACELEQHRLHQFASRSFENMVAVAMANYASPQENGRSLVFDGMAFTREGASRSMLLVEAGATEEVVLAQLDLDALRAYRAHETWGNAFRKPVHYQPLQSTTVGAPFVRDSSRR